MVRKIERKDERKDERKIEPLSKGSNEEHKLRQTNKVFLFFFEVWIFRDKIQEKDIYCHVNYS